MKSLASTLVMVACLALVSCGKDNTDPQGGGGSGGGGGGSFPSIGGPSTPQSPSTAATGFTYLGSIKVTQPDGTKVCTELRAKGPQQIIELMQNGMAQIQGGQGSFSATEKCSTDGVVGICEGNKSENGVTMNIRGFAQGNAAELKAKCEAEQGTWTAL